MLAYIGKSCHLCVVVLNKTNMTKYDAITRKYREVEISGSQYTENGQPLYRVETKGKSGRTLYATIYYISDGKELPVYGMGGATGHGWGGRIIGYVTKDEAKANNIKI
jgi:hypothetical protein